MNGCETPVAANDCRCPMDAIGIDCTMVQPNETMQCEGFGAGVVGAECVSLGCRPGLRRCNTTCTDTETDPSNCGGCGVVCGSGSCTAGMCDPPMA